MSTPAIKTKGDVRIEHGPDEKYLVVLGDGNLDMSQRSALAAQKPTISWAASKEAWPAG